MAIDTVNNVGSFAVVEKRCEICRSTDGVKIIKVKVGYKSRKITLQKRLCRSCRRNYRGK